MTPSTPFSTGFGFVVLDETTFAVESTNTFDTSTDASAEAAMATYLNNI